MQRVLHIDDHNLFPLKPHVAQFVMNGLQKLQDTKIEFDHEVKLIYANEIFGRVAEIDNAFEGLYIALDRLGVNEFQNTQFDFSALHSFHVENFLIRSTGIVDRCHLLAGTSILLEKKSIEKLGGKRQIERALIDYPSCILEGLKSIGETVSALRKRRNEVAHNSGYSSKNLCALSFIEKLDEIEKEKFDEIISTGELKKIIISDSLGLFEPVVNQMHISVSNLISSLSYIYKEIFD